jgi:predicted Zn-dependent protease
MGIYNNRRRSSFQGFRGRLLIALILMGVGLFSYMTNTEVNPITGAKQHVSLTPEQEIRLGIQSAPEMAAQMGGKLPASDPRTQEVQKIGNTIIQRSQARRGPWQFQFHLLADSQTVNAFALPGGQIFITLGLLNKLKTEAQLAGVLAHESGHVIQRHSAQQLAKGQLGNMLVLATAVGASDSQNPGRGYQAAMIAGLVNQMTQLHYSRQDESEADEWGLKLMTEAGYTPRAMLEVMHILKEASARSQYSAEIFQSHPNPDLRIEHIQKYLKEHPPSPNLTEGRNLQEVLDTQGL